MKNYQDECYRAFVEDDIISDPEYFGLGRPETEYKRYSINLWSLCIFFVRAIEILFVVFIVSIIVIVVFDL